MKIEVLLLSVSAASVSLGCSGTADSGFDLWCGDSLCSWNTEAGSIRRVPTWHEKDYGVELVERGTILSQEVTQYTPRGCLKFAITADVTAEAEVYLELDIFSDGSLDHSQPLPGMDWQRQELLVKLPETSYSALTIKLDKKGTGRSVFAELAAEFVPDCNGDPIVLQNLGLGARCGESAQCQSGACTAVKPGAPESPFTPPLERTCTAPLP
jgi:hypothetical protein